MTFSETIFLFVVALIVFGPKKLPEIARQVGKALNEFRRASNEFKAQIEQEIAHLEVENRKETILPPSPPPEGTASRTLSASSSEVPVVAETTPQAPAAEEPATLAASAEEPVSPPAAEPATEALPVTEAVTSSSSQESHA